MASSPGAGEPALVSSIEAENAAAARARLPRFSKNAPAAREELVFCAPPWFEEAPHLQGWTTPWHRASPPRLSRTRSPAPRGCARRCRCSSSRTTSRTSCSRSSTRVEGREGATLVIGGDGRYYNDAACRRSCGWRPPTASAAILVGQRRHAVDAGGACVIRKRRAIGGVVLSASHNPGRPGRRFRHQVQCRQRRPGAGEGDRGDLARGRKEIGRYRIVEAPDVDLDRLGEHAGSAQTRVEIVDPVADYAELMERLFDFDAIGAPVARPASGCASTRCTRSPALMPRRSSKRRLGAPAGTVVNGEPLPDFGGHHPDPNPVHAARPDASDARRRRARFRRRLGRRRRPQHDRRPARRS